MNGLQKLTSNWYNDNEFRSKYDALPHRLRSCCHSFEISKNFLNSLLISASQGPPVKKNSIFKKLLSLRAFKSRDSLQSLC